ncbi:YneF family protein [Granulicatella sp. zg-ZJ]|uniref:YneF family protein n=1 Tax=unclassified Granulicatella TaxID=2630493 RepID=UPI0013C272D7|nr:MULTISPECIES: YneF family protein [unclassified Granulicatella]NEW63412.1 YneF family protein [Granulicatella sp. zg-ZJ]NEW66771.1 YneF family protein [Granulicatella sp. zg-84]QMI85359.1 YneF family protein [Carnobacteriaceae bacterium zg-84]
MDTIWVVLIAFAAMALGVVGGFFLARRTMIKYFEENPPMDETMVRTMMAQMGQKPSEKKVQQIVQSMKMQSKKKNKK